MILIKIYSSPQLYADNKLIYLLSAKGFEDQYNNIKMLSFCQISITELSGNSNKLDVARS